MNKVIRCYNYRSMNTNALGYIYLWFCLLFWGLAHVRARVPYAEQPDHEHAFCDMFRLQSETTNVHAVYGNTNGQRRQGLAIL